MVATSRCFSHSVEGGKKRRLDPPPTPWHTHNNMHTLLSYFTQHVGVGCYHVVMSLWYAT